MKRLAFAPAARSAGFGPRSPRPQARGRSTPTQTRGRSTHPEMRGRSTPRQARGWFARSLCGALLLFGVTHASAALFDDDEARKRIDVTNTRLSEVQRQLEERIAALEVQLKNQGLVELFNTVEQMKADVAKLRGQLEVLTYELDQSGKRQRDLYVDLDSRLRKLESAPGSSAPSADAGAPTPAGSAAPPATGAGTGASPPAVPGALGAAPVALPVPLAPASATEQRAYDAALEQFKGGSYGAAIGSFTSFVKNYPRSSLAPSAQYWVGNAQFAQKNFRGAIASQRQLVAAYPDSQKVPDALLNIATCQFELGDAASSRRTLEELIGKFPQSESAAKAKQRLGMR